MTDLDRLKHSFDAGDFSIIDEYIAVLERRNLTRQMREVFVSIYRHIETSNIGGHARLIHEMEQGTAIYSLRLCLLAIVRKISPPEMRALYVEFLQGQATATAWECSIFCFERLMDTAWRAWLQQALPNDYTVSILPGDHRTEIHVDILGQSYLVFKEEWGVVFLVNATLLPSLPSLPSRLTFSEMSYRVWGGQISVCFPPSQGSPPYPDQDRSAEICRHNGLSIVDILHGRERQACFITTCTVDDVIFVLAGSHVPFDLQLSTVPFRGQIGLYTKPAGVPIRGGNIYFDEDFDETFPDSAGIGGQQKQVLI